MYIVKKQDPWGNWVEIYRAQKFEDADRFRNGIGGGKLKDITKIERL